MPPLKVAVVGCGTAGPAAAILLRRLGHEVTVCERAPACAAVGAGFLLQPTGMAVLRELGILDRVLSRAARITRLHVVEPDESTLLDLSYQELDPGLFGAGLHRPVLLDALLASLRDASVPVHWGVEVIDAEKRGGAWFLKSRHSDQESGPFDLVIIADGARSSLRRLVSTRGVNRGYPWGAHWFIGENRGAFPENTLYQIVRGTRRLSGYLATGTVSENGPPLVSLFWSVRIDQDADWRSRPLDEWKQEVLSLCPRAAPLLEQIQSWDQITLARYGDVRMPSWQGEGIVVLGDAGHAMSPQLGQGVNLALADASELASCIASADALPAALRRYARRRAPHLRFYQIATRWLTPWFQSDHEWLSPLRRIFFTICRHLPPARRFMTLTMAGLVFAGKSRLPRANSESCESGSR